MGEPKRFYIQFGKWMWLGFREQVKKIILANSWPSEAGRRESEGYNRGLVAFEAAIRKELE